MDAHVDNVDTLGINDLLFSDYGTYREVNEECKSLQLTQTETTMKSRWNKSMIIVGESKTMEQSPSKYKHDKEEIGTT